MPVFSASPFTTVTALSEGLPAYSAGTAPGNPTKMYATAMSVTSDVVTLYVSVESGNIPSAGDLITVIGAYVPAANVTNVALASVSITASTGVGTVTYDATTPNLAKTASGGNAISVPQAVGETMTASTGYQSFAVPRSVPAHIDGRPISVYVDYGGSPTILCNLQGAINNVDAEYTDLPTAEYISSPPFSISANGTYFYNLPNIYNFVRFADEGSSGGTDPTVIAKILI